MCYSAQIYADYRKFEREFGAVISLRHFVQLFWEKRHDGGWNKLPKAMRASFNEPRGEDQRELASLVVEGDRNLAAALETELFEQKTRLTGAQRTLATKPTKKAENDQRIATDKIARAQRNLSDLQRSELVDRDSRIFPGHYAPVMVVQDGKRVVIPMRYQCRLPGWTEAMERQKPGTYNALGTLLTVKWKRFSSNQPLRAANSFS